MTRTCFHEVNLESGAKMVEMFGYDLPWEYKAGGEAEHMATDRGWVLHRNLQSIKQNVN